MTRPAPIQKVAAFAVSVLLSSSVAVAQQGFVNYQNVNSVIYRAETRKIYDLFESSTGWQVQELVAQAPLAAYNPVPYVRSDNVNSVVYSTDDHHIIELFQVPGYGWQYGDLSYYSDSLIFPSNRPAAFVRADGVNSVVFNVDQFQPHVWFFIAEIYNSPQGWTFRNLSALAGIPHTETLSPIGRPAPYVRSDGYNSVVYRHGNHIREIFFTAAGAGYGDLNYYSGAPAAASNANPYPYVRWDGYNCVLYKGSDGHIYELFLGATWDYGDLTYYSGVPSTAYSDPHPYRRSDGYNSVVFMGYDYTYFPPRRAIYELFLGSSWGYGDLTRYAGAPEPSPTAEPHPYIRNDGVNSVVYVDNYGHIIDLYLTDTWHYRDLTVEAAGHP